ncbi:MAG: peroxiredoxin-like family protein [Bacteriovoracaceae bacterium]
MSSIKLSAGDKFPDIKVKVLDGEDIKLGVPKNGATWQMVVVYRGKHCPLCTKYLAKISEMKEDFLNVGVDIVVVSADTEEKAKLQAQEKLNLSFDVGYDLSIEQMKELGVYISDPRSPQETDRPFAEPGLFIVNEDFNLHVVDISNNPFVRPELSALLSGINWIRNPENNYPIRGTFK